MVNNILIKVLGPIAGQERASIRQRQAKGIEAAKRSGKKLGRPALILPADWHKENQFLQIGQYDGNAVKRDTVCAGHISLCSDD